MVPLLHHCRLLAVQDGAGSVNGICAQIWAVLVLADRAHGAARVAQAFLLTVACT